MSDIAPHTADLSSAMPTAAAAGTASEAPQPGNESATDTPSSAPADSTGRAPRTRAGKPGQARAGGRNGGGRNRNDGGNQGNGGGHRGGQGRPAQGQRPARAPYSPPTPQHPVLAKLAEIEATLFGGDALPLKRGIFQDLMVAHPGVFDKDELKSALALYTRSTRYLIALASGQPRHDLSGQPVEAVAPEHRYHALVETFRRRHARTGEDVRQKLYERILQAAEDSLLAPGDYATQMRSKDEAANEILDAAMAELGSRVAREEALLRAFDASGQSVNGFADAYGLHPIEAAATLTRARNRAAAIAQAAAAAEAQAAQAATEAAAQAEETTEAAAEADDGNTADEADTTAEAAAPSEDSADSADSAEPEQAAPSAA